MPLYNNYIIYGLRKEYETYFFVYLFIFTARTQRRGKINNKQQKKKTNQSKYVYFSKMTRNCWKKSGTMHGLQQIVV